MAFWYLVIISSLLFTIGKYFWRVYQHNKVGYYKKINLNLFENNWFNKINQKPKKNFLSKFLGWFLIMYILTGMLFFVTSMIVDNTTKESIEYDYTYNIYSLEDSIANTFIIRRYYQTENSSGIRFYHIYKTGDGGKKISWVNHNDSTIFDSLKKEEQPYREYKILCVNE
jgi:hypothetical protein